jgi:hypothetical protein
MLGFWEMLGLPLSRQVAEGGLASTNLLALPLRFTSQAPAGKDKAGRQRNDIEGGRPDAHAKQRKGIAYGLPRRNCDNRQKALVHVARSYKGGIFGLKLKGRIVSDR